MVNPAVIIPIATQVFAIQGSAQAHTVAIQIIFSVEGAQVASVLLLSIANGGVLVVHVVIQAYVQLTYHQTQISVKVSSASHLLNAELPLMDLVLELASEELVV